MCVKKTIADILLKRIDDGFTVKLSSHTNFTYNLTKGNDKRIICLGWDGDKDNWYECSVDNHTINGKYIGVHSMLTQL